MGLHRRILTLTTKPHPVLPSQIPISFSLLKVTSSALTTIVTGSSSCTFGFGGGVCGSFFLNRLHLEDFLACSTCALTTCRSTLSGDMYFANRTAISWSDHQRTSSEDELFVVLSSHLPHSSKALSLRGSFSFLGACFWSPTNLRSSVTRTTVREWSSSSKIQS